MRIQWTKNKSSLVIIGVISLLSSCKTGLQLDQLPLDENILQDARDAFFESDRTGIVNDYAQVDTGEKTSDGFTITERTDADSIMNQATSDKKRLFIQLPSGEARRDHILRAIASASIREDLKKGDRWNIIVLNTKAIKSKIASFALDDTKAKQYYLSVAKKVNAKLKSNDIVVVDVDDFAYGLTADEFFAVLSKPHVIALSKMGVDSIKAFEDKAASDEFLSKGLNPGHVYKLAKLRMLRSKNIKKAADQEKVALIVAKVVTAIEPSGNLGSLAKFFTLIDPIVDGETPNTDLDKTIMKALSAFFQANYDFLVELQLENKTLSQIHDEVKQNTLAFNEQARKTDEILQGMKKILKSRLAVLADLMAKGFKTTHSHLDDLRSNVLPGIEQNLLNDGAHHRDEIMRSAKRNVESAISRLTEEGQARHGETTRDVIKRVGALIETTEDQIVARASERMEIISGTFFDNVQAALRKLQAETTATTTKAARDVNDTTQKLLQRAIGTVNDHVTAVGKTTEGAVGEGLARTGDDVKLHGRLMSARVTNDVTRSINERIAKAQSELARGTTNAVQDSEAIVTKALAMEASDVRDLLMQAAKRIISENKTAIAGVSTSVNQHSNAVMKRVERVLADALLQTENELRRKMVGEHEATRSELTAHADRTTSRATSALIEQNTAQHGTTRGTVTRAVAKSVDDARAGIEQMITKEAQDTKDIVNDAVTRAIKKIIAETQSGSDAVRDDINKHTTTTVKRGQNTLADALVQAEDAITRRVQEEGQTTRDEGKAVVSKETAQASTKAIDELRAAIAAAQKRIMAQSGAVAADAQDALDKIIGRQTDETQALMRELIAFSIRRITGDNRAAIEGLTSGINTHTTGMIKRAQQMLSDALSQAEEEIKKRVSEEGVAARNEVTSGVSKRVTNAAFGVIAELRKQLDNAQKRLAAHTTGTVGDAQDAIMKNQNEISDAVQALVSDTIATAIKKIVAENRAAITGLSDGINRHTTGSVKNVQRLLVDALVQAEDEIKKRVGDEGLSARNEVTSSVTKRVTTSAAEVIGQMRKYVDDMQKRLVTTTTGTVGDAQGAIEKVQRDTADDVKDAVRDALTAAIKKIVDEAQGARAGTTEDITAEVTGAVKKARDAVIERVGEAEGAVTKLVTNESDVTRQSVSGLLQRSRVAIIERTIEEQRAMQRRLMKQNDEVASKTRDEISDEIRRQAEDIVQRLDERILRALRIHGAQNQKLVKSITDATVAATRSEGRLTREDVARSESEVRSIVERESERIVNDMARESGKTRQRTLQLLRAASGINFPAYFVYNQFYRELVNLVGNVLGQSFYQFNEVTKHRIEKAAEQAYQDYQGNNTALNIVAQANGAFNQPVVMPMLALNGAQLVGGDALHDILSTSQTFIQIVNRARAMENLNNAPNPDIFVDDDGDANIQNTLPSESEFRRPGKLLFDEASPILNGEGNED